jgi:hypothetical protein
MLGRTIEEHQAQAEAVAKVVTDLRRRLAQTGGLQHEVLTMNHRRLYQGFTDMLKAIEEVCGARIGISQRLDAVILSSEVGVSLGKPQDVTSARMGSFVQEAVAAPARSAI